MFTYEGLTQRAVLRVLLDGNWDNDSVVLKTVLGTRLRALQLPETFTTSNGLRVWLSYDGKFYAGERESRVVRFIIRGKQTNLDVGHALAHMVHH